MNSLVLFILIGLVVGWLAEKLLQDSGFGVLGDIAIGVVGAVMSGFLFRALGVSSAFGLIGSLIAATTGAVVLLLAMRQFSRV